MIQNIEKGRGFGGAVKYIIEKEKAELIGGTMLSNDVAGLIKEAAVVRGLNSKLKKAVFHASLSIGVDDNLTEEQWVEIGDRYMIEMGFENSPYILARHKDTEHDHVHIAALRIDTKTRKTVSDSKDFERGAKVVQQIEIDYGLTKVAQTPAQTKEKAIKNLNKNELEMSVRTGMAAPRQVLQNLVNEAIKDVPSIFEFIDRLEMAGVEVRPAVAKTGRMNGFSFKYNNIPFKASGLGKQYGWKKLSESVNYEQERDSAKLIEISERARDRANQDNSRDSELDRANEHQSSTVDGGAEGVNSRVDVSSEGGAGVSKGEQEREQNLNKSLRRSEQNSKSGSESNKKTSRRRDENDQQKIVNNNDERSIDSIRNNVNSLSDLSAPVIAGREESGAVVSSGSAGNAGRDIKTNELAPDHIKKIAAWDRQHGALQSPLYRITIVPRRDENRKTFNLGKKKDGETFYSPDDIKELIGQLRRFNAMGNDIYITPIDDNHHYVLLDDAIISGINELKNKGYYPVLVQESSANNLQAIYKADRKSSRKNEQADANKMMSILNKEFGDKKISAVIHPFRMSGFTNAKPDREVAGKRPFTRILETSSGSSKMSVWLENIRIETDAGNVKKEVVRREKMAVSKELTDSKHLADAEQRFSVLYKKYYGLAKRMRWEIDASRIDFSAAKEMLVDGYSADDIHCAIANVSPNLIERHADIERYVSATVLHASQDKDVIKKIENGMDSGRDPGR